MSKRPITSFFAPSVKRVAVEQDIKYSHHPNYPCPIKQLNIDIEPNSIPKQVIQKHLDILHFHPFLSGKKAQALFQHLRTELPFYRVNYTAVRDGNKINILTPRYTTVFGIDATCQIREDGKCIDKKSGKIVHTLNCKPRPIPQCLQALRLCTEEATEADFNICLVNYYASGSDSISYHSDSEPFLGPRPQIASFSLGASRDFLMKHKDDKELKWRVALNSGDMVHMRGDTQARWLHSIPKRAGSIAADGGRINITFRKALEPSGTDNYYHYNVGDGPLYRWDNDRREMIIHEKTDK